MDAVDATSTGMRPRGCSVRGRASLAAMLVGEQPGHRRGSRGPPVVGPAGALLDRALVDARIPHEGVYLTNVVKHFRFTRSGKRRIHQTPDSGEIEACGPWLFKELAIIRPERAGVLVLERRPRNRFLDRAFGSRNRTGGSSSRSSRRRRSRNFSFIPSAALRAAGFRRPPGALPAAGERSTCCRARGADLRAPARDAGGSS